MKISGYTTIKNAVEMDYPFEATIRSLADFCDEVVVVDSSNKDDGTQGRLEALMDEIPQLNVYQLDIPWNAPNHGIYDGLTKAFAREQCTGDFLWQMDCDEVVQPNSRKQIEKALEKTNYLKQVPLLALPVVEYWGGIDKVRIDVNPWKWRISRNDPKITHGIPSYLRWEKDGLLYSKPGSDGCDYINKDSGLLIPCLNFLTKEIDELRNKAINNAESATEYEKWFNSVVEELPTVYHFSWWSIASKIQKYKYFWNDSWLSLYGEKSTKPEGWNPFFNKSLETVSDEEIISKAKQLSSETGGHIFHTAWVGQKTNSIKINKPIPEYIKSWAEKHSV